MRLASYNTVRQNDSGRSCSLAFEDTNVRVVELTCSNCGASKLIEKRASEYACEYCGATYLVELDSATGALADIDVAGSMQDIEQVFAVHGKLEVTGSMNNVAILESAPDARHVGALKVSGSMNDISAILLDGARCDVTGHMNDIERKHRV